MKLSEAVNLLWEAACHAVHDKKDLEAALLCIVPGHKWDPEEEPLPKRLASMDAIDCASAYRRHLVPETGDGWASEEQQRRGYDEAARCYNLMPSLVKIAKRLSNAAEGDREDLSMIQEDLDRALGIVTNAGVRGLKAWLDDGEEGQR